MPLPTTPCLPLTAAPSGPRATETTPTTRRRLTLLPLMALGALTGCAQPPSVPEPGRTPSHLRLPTQQAWVEGQRVLYVSTDVSDRAMARDLGLNYVPRLQDALPGPGTRSVVERVYKFAGREQINVFPSTPLPTGAENADAAYSPLWRLVWVRWRPGAAVRELRSEEAVLAAEEAGELQLEVTRIVINCPVIRSSDGLWIRGASAG